jgi:hypothetical protein
VGSGRLFTTPTGGLLNPRTDYDEWKLLLHALRRA